MLCLLQPQASSCFSLQPSYRTTRTEVMKESPFG